MNSVGNKICNRIFRGLSTIPVKHNLESLVFVWNTRARVDDLIFVKKVQRQVVYGEEASLRREREVFVSFVFENESSEKLDIGKRLLWLHRRRTLFLLFMDQNLYCTFASVSVGELTKYFKGFCLRKRKFEGVKYREDTFCTTRNT